MIVSGLKPFSVFVDKFGIGDSVAVFYVSELGTPNRVVGTCVSKRRALNRFSVATAAGVVYSFNYRNRNLVAVKRLLHF